ncbi:MAG: NTP transferase domain-containing protein [Roseomonas mucosa]|nr:NTP transferase domain-containing protein [Roseomonas mucosa]
MIVFPMAGLSSRFTKAGYDRPKWMLPLAGRPLLDWSLLGFSEMFESETFLLIHLDRPGVAEFVRARAEAIGIRNLRMVALPEPTRGQAETVQLGLDGAEVPNGEPVTIFNIDTIRPGVREVVEKRRIAPFCCSGLYHFGSATLFRDAYARELAAPSTNELYVAPMYRHLIEAGHKVRYGTIPMEEIFFSGTPAEYEALLGDTKLMINAFPVEIRRA